MRSSADDETAAAEGLTLARRTTAVLLGPGESMTASGRRRLLRQIKVSVDQETGNIYAHPPAGWEWTMDLGDDPRTTHPLATGLRRLE